MRVLEEFEAERALAENDVRVVVRRDEARTRLLDDLVQDDLTLDARAAAEHDVGAVVLCPCNLGRCGDRGHDDVRWYAVGLRRESEGLGVVSLDIG